MTPCPQTHTRSRHSEALGDRHSHHLPVTDDLPEGKRCLLDLLSDWSTLAAIATSGQCRWWPDSSRVGQGTEVTSPSDSPSMFAGGQGHKI